ncbi:hypothetical protein DL766_002746 [Monosporascus sp. MC13-8B]|uniref:Fucose-specific lectin n=1 Tax=Monosporascus cannonballus TaxID=155416 RepID=A0ABY0HMI0_9PEZI|nr:hypothetical protein DL763_010693 [Monosporascus cannonballus]RYO94873.1 hypothetical protein DL762_000307 [Monosporascus cannonballus]RYP34905.1 hypothetical protein DL766_002746 [Monosporascus sp. MC13-8B]
MRDMAVLTQLLAWIWLVLNGVHGSFVAAWYDELFGAPQVISFDTGDKKIYYSLCNSNGLPVFPANESATFNLRWTPFRSTTVAGVGYQEDGVNHAVIFYQRDDLQLVGQVFACENTGYFSTQDVQSWVITSDVDAPIQRGGAIAAIKLSDGGGYRVYYKNDYSHTGALRYIPSEGNWKDDGFVSQDQNMAFSVAAGLFDNGHITVVNPRNDNVAVEVMTLQGTTWVINTFPVPLEFSNVTDDTSGNENFQYNETTFNNYEPLEAFESLKARMSLVYDSNGTRSIFYIGSDNDLHQVKHVDGVWEKVVPEDRLFWPRSDVPNSSYGYAFDAAHDKIWIYYYSNGTVAQMHQSGLDTWEAATSLPRTPLPTETSTPDPQESDNPEGSAQSGALSTGASAGIGVGVGLGIVLVASAAAYYALRMKRLHANRPAGNQDITGGGDLPEASQGPQVDKSYGVYRTVYEMHQDERRHEMTGDGHIWELASTPIER